MDKVFRRAFMGGFRKKEVVAYLDQLAKEHTDEINDLKERNAALERQLGESVKQYASDQGVLAGLRQICSELEKKAALLTGELAAAKEALQENRLQLAKTEALAAMQNKQLSDFSAENEALKKRAALLNGRIASLEQVEQEHEGLKSHLLRLEKTAKHPEGGSLETIRARLNQIAEELSMLAKEAGQASAKTAVRTPVRPQGQPLSDKEPAEPYSSVRSILSRISRQGKAEQRQP